MKENTVEEVKRLQHRLIRAYDWVEKMVNGNDAAMMDYTEYVCEEERDDEPIVIMKGEGDRFYAHFYEKENEVVLPQRDNWREGLVTTKETMVRYATWFCRNCGNERLCVGDGNSICLNCDTEKHGFQAITDLLHEVIRGD